jgi:hydroxypyruvate isomerase
VHKAHVDTEITRRTLLRGVLALAGGAVASGMLAACGPAVPTASAPTAKPAAGQPQKGGSLIMASGDALVPDLSYGNAFGPQGFTALQWMWPLFRTKPASFEVIPALAEGYAPSADRLSHKVTLRPDIKFHDGSPIDANAVAANLKAAFNQNDPLRGSGAYQGITTFFGGFPGNFKAVDVNDARNLTITLNQPRADLRGADDPATRRAGRDFLKRYVDHAAELGSPLLSGALYGTVFTPRYLTPEERALRWGYTVEALAELAPYAESAGVRIPIEPLSRFHTSLVNTAADGRKLVDEVGHPAIGLLLDSFQMNIEEKSLSSAVRTAGERVFHVHAAENDRGTPGTGQVHWTELRDGLRVISATTVG